MNKGGKRTGAGRPKGARSKSSIAAEELQSKALEDGLSPLAFMLGVMRGTITDRKDAEGSPIPMPMEFRGEMAGRAAPYLHKRMPQVLEGSGDGGSFNVNINIGSKASGHGDERD